MESDRHIICSLHPHVSRSNPSATLQPQPWFEDFSVDASMDKCKKRQLQQLESDFKPRRPADEGRRTKMRMGKEITDSRGKNSNSTSSYRHIQTQPNDEGGGCRGRSARPGFDSQTNDNLYKTSARGPSLPPPPGFDPQTNVNLYKTSARGPNLLPRPSVNEKKVVNWRLACFMCHEYLTRGTLLGIPWAPRDSKPNWDENSDKSQPKSGSLDQHGDESSDKSQPKSGSLDQHGDESRREKERLYHTVADFLQAGDVHLPDIVNPSQLAAWLGL